MKVKKIQTFAVFVLFLIHIFFLLSFSLAAEKNSEPELLNEIEKKVEELMEKGEIQGLALVIVKGDQPLYIKGFGYANVEKQTPVTGETLFELGSTSKAFTALAVLQLEKDGLINLDDPVSKHLERFSVTYKGKEYPVTLRQVLHQTSGIPFKTLGLIPESEADDALQQTVRNLEGIELREVPGEEFHYATINYDVIGAVIEKVTGMSFEGYITKHVFRPLGLTHTRAGVNKNDPLLSTGYRVSFFKPRAYDAPVYRGNTPAGYIVSNANDMARWLQFHMGHLDPGADMRSLMEKSHEPDMSVLPGKGGRTSYAMGWNVQQFGGKQIWHGGLNPNFTSYVGFRPEDKVGVVVLANTNSNYTSYIGDCVMALARGEPVPDDYAEGRTIDDMASIFSLGLGLYLLVALLFLLNIFFDLLRKRRQYDPFSLGKLVKLVGGFFMFVPFAVGVYLLPMAIRELPWEVASVWTPTSFDAAAILLLACMAVSYLSIVFSSFFPVKNQYVRSIPMVIVLSLLSGGANALVILLISSSLFSEVKLIYLIYFYALAFFIYILGRKVIQTRLTQITFRIVYDLRMRLIDKVFLTTYQRFEKLDRGRVFATLNDDTGQVATSANVIVALITSIITSLCAFVYLFTIAFWATAITLGVVIFIATLYGVVSGKARQYFEEARDTRNVYMGLLNGLLDGFKELSLKINKKRQYRDDVENTTDEFQSKMSMAIIRFINAFLIGESMLLVVLGAVSFGIPRVFPDISTFTLMTFIMVLLYLIGPVNGILNSIPTIMQIRVAWNM